MAESGLPARDGEAASRSALDAVGHHLLRTCPGCKRPATAKGRNYCLPCMRDYAAIRRERKRALKAAILVPPSQSP